MFTVCTAETEEAHLVAWLSKRLEASIRAPDLQNEDSRCLARA